LEGLGNVISNLSVKNPTDSGLAGLIDASAATIRDLGLTKVSVSSAGGIYSAAGALVAENFLAPIIRCFATGKVSVGDTGEVGGLVGENLNGGLISRSSATVSVIGGGECP
jgi:hypothetical protein